MASGRPDFHPTMLLEGKHDTELIPVLVDANGQMYIVMTGQAIAVTNLASDYFKAGEAVTVPGGVGVVNLPSDYFKAGQGVGAVSNIPSDYFKANQAVGSVASIAANVTVDQSAKDRDMIGLDTATRRQIAVDAAGIILARLKGAYGATLKDIAVDDVGILLSRLKGAYGATLKDIAVDDVGILLSRMKGAYGGVLKDVAVDASGVLQARLMGLYGGALKDVLVDYEGNMVTRILGWDGTAGQWVKVDTGGNMLARMKGYDGAALQDVKVDSAGYMLAKMTGIEGANLRTVAVDASGIMKANLAVQDLAYLKFRPVYGSGVRASVSPKACPTDAETTLLEVAGKGATYGALIYLSYVSEPGDQRLRIYIDDVEFFYQTMVTMRARNSQVADHLPLFLLQDDNVNFKYAWGVKPGITFESKLKITYYHSTGADLSLYVDLFYALVP